MCIRDRRTGEQKGIQQGRHEGMILGALMSGKTPEEVDVYKRQEYMQGICIYYYRRITNRCNKPEIYIFRYRLCAVSYTHLISHSNISIGSAFVLAVGIMIRSAPFSVQVRILSGRCLS